MLATSKIILILALVLKLSELNFSKHNFKVALITYCDCL